MNKELFQIYKDLITYEENYIKKTLDRANYIELFLDGLDFEKFEHWVLVPDWKEYYLEIDGKEVKALPNGLESGEIDELNIKDSSDLENNYNYPNINFNSKINTNEDISTPVFYNTTALAVSKSTIKKLLETKDVFGKLKVKIKDVKNVNFVIGNLDSDLAIVVHYDALWYGAIDNTSSLGLILHMIKNNELDLNKMVIFLIGFTEVSYYWPEYWDYSFRRVVEKYDFNRYKKVFIIDCIGYKNTQFLYDKEYIEAYSIFGKNLIIFGTPLEDLFPIYHSTNDTIDKLNFRQLEKDKIAILSKIKEVFSEN